MTKEQIPCVFCKTGHLGPGTATFMDDKDGTIIAIRNVPALVCDECGEESFEASIAEKLLELARQLAQSGAPVEIREYDVA